MADSINIETLRQARGWTQQQMAEYLGVDRSTVSRLESGQRPSGPIVRLLGQLANETKALSGALPSAESSV